MSGWKISCINCSKDFKSTDEYLAHETDCDRQQKIKQQKNLNENEDAIFLMKLFNISGILQIEHFTELAHRGYGKTNIPEYVLIRVFDHGDYRNNVINVYSSFDELRDAIDNDTVDIFVDGIAKKFEIIKNIIM